MYQLRELAQTTAVHTLVITGCVLMLLDFGDEGFRVYKLHVKYANRKRTTSSSLLYLLTRQEHPAVRRETRGYNPPAPLLTRARLDWTRRKIWSVKHFPADTPDVPGGYFFGKPVYVYNTVLLAGLAPWTRGTPKSTLVRGTVEPP